MIKKFIPLIAGIGLLFAAGCGTLVPKPVELFQDKVKEFPETQKKDREAERQALELTQKRVRDLKEEVIKEGLKTNIVAKVKDLENLTDALAKNAGPPLDAPRDDAERVTRRLYESTAGFVERVFKFRSKNDENAGKEIEGTGLIRVPYLVWLGGVVLFVFIIIIIAMVLRTALKVYATTNPPLALGLSAVQVGAAGVKKMFSQTIKGVEEFKNRLFKTVESGKETFTADEVKTLLREELQKAHDEETQTVVKHLTK